MKWVLIFIAVVWIGATLVDIANAPAKAEREAAARALTSDQRALLVELQRVGTPAAAKLAAEWAEAYPQPTAETLTELQLLVERVKTDPTTAASFTVEEKRRGREALASKIEPVFGWSDDDDIKPGL